MTIGRSMTFEEAMEELDKGENSSDPNAYIMYDKVAKEWGIEEPPKAICWKCMRKHECPFANALRCNFFKEWDKW